MLTASHSWLLRSLQGFVILLEKITEQTQMMQTMNPQSALLGVLHVCGMLVDLSSLLDAMAK